MNFTPAADDYDRERIGDIFDEYRITKMVRNEINRPIIYCAVSNNELFNQKERIIKQYPIVFLIFI